MQILCTTAYWAPASYYRAMAQAGKTWLELHENYTRQTYRNRCLILGANGVMTLSVPIKKGPRPKVPIQEVEIDYSEPWQRLHYKTLFSAYRRSPFFDFYIDDLRSCFEIKPRTLVELNNAVFAAVGGVTGMNMETGSTEAWGEIPGSATVKDLREAFNPRRRHTDLPAYEQVFSARYGFEADLSILDVLFNLGPETRNYLNEKKV